MQERQMQFAQRLKAFQPAPWDQIPDLGLYMDQVITYVERQCAGLYPEGERILTPSMVNNYVKMGLIGRPAGKKYAREQLAQLLMVCMLKQAASAEGMKVLMQLPQGGSIQALYEDFCQQQQTVTQQLLKALPLPSPLYCAVQSAAYSFLCNVLLAKDTESASPKEEAPAPKSGDTPSKRKEQEP